MRRNERILYVRGHIIWGAVALPITTPTPTSNAGCEMYNIRIAGIGLKVFELHCRGQNTDNKAGVPGILWLDELFKIQDRL